MHWIDVLEQHAQTRPDAPALHVLPEDAEIGATLGFAQLHQESQTWAAALQTRFAPGERVLLALPSGLDFVRAFCACVYADLIAVPLFPPQSRKPRHLERLKTVIADAAPALVLAPADACDVLAELGPAAVQTVDALRDADALAWRRPASRGQTIAFLQYTSGSTGTPKGVIVRQRNLLANLELMRHAYGLSPQGRMVNWLPLYHDMGLIGGVLAALFAGMPCHLIPPQNFVRTPSVWLQAISRHRATVSFAPNFAYALAARTASDALVAQLDLRCWEHAINGAEPIHAPTLMAFAERFTPAGFKPSAASPGYGQAEATLCVSATPANTEPRVLRLDKVALEAGSVRFALAQSDAVEFVACGYPQPHHAVAIVDPQHFTRCAPDRVGEIWLAGPSNAEGYWNRPQAGAETFEATIDGDPGRYLRSGDLGFLHDGQLVVCGRLKDLVILNGRNLYPNDLEFSITEAVPAIRAGRIAAFALPDPALGREKLVVVAEPHRRFVDPALHDELFAAMQQAVREAADCAIDLIVLIEAGTIPMTTSGKISRQGARRAWERGELEVLGTNADDAADDAIDLRRLRSEGGHGAEGLALCRGYLAATLRALQPGLRAGFNASLLAQGLDSIALASLAARLQLDFSWTPAMHALFDERPLAAWAEALQQHLQTRQTEAAPDKTSNATTDMARQSYAQRRLWFLQRLDPAASTHNVVLRLSWRGPLDSAQLQARLDAAVARHAVLRSVCRDAAEGPMQQVLPPAPAAWFEQTCPSPGLESAVQQHITAERAAPFDLEAGPSLRATLLSDGAQAHELVLTLHHITFDGRSAELLLQALAGETAPDAPAYTAFARWEAAHWNANALETGLTHWRERLTDMPPQLTLGISAHPEAALAFELPAAACERLARFARARRMTPFMALMTLYQVLLHHVSGQQRFVVGTDVTGRPPAFEHTFGFFVNQLPLPCRLDGDPTLAELFARTRVSTLEAYEHQLLPFDLLVSALAPPRVPGRAPLFQTKLNFQHAPPCTAAVGQARLAGMQVLQTLGEFDLVLDLVQHGRRIEAALKHRLPPPQAERLRDLWLLLLDRFEQWLDQPLSTLAEPLHAAERAAERERQQQRAAEARARLATTRRRAVSA